MSSQAGRGPNVPVAKKGLSKYLLKIKSALKKKEKKTESKQTSAPSSTAPAMVVSRTSEPAMRPDESFIVDTAEPPASDVDPAIASLDDRPGVSKIMRSQIDSDRARRLGERFKLPIEPSEWTLARPEKTIYRIEKPIRMRVHRICHRCNTTFGGTKECPGCAHRTCTKCPRFPPKSDKSVEKSGGNELPVIMAGDIEVDNDDTPAENIILTKPNKSGGQPLVRKRPMQRVRRTCHECSSLFPGGTKVCPSCQHLRCADCPRDPAKKKKFPDGYPGDQFSPTSTAPIRYACHNCTEIFPPVPHPNSPEGLALGDTIEPLECTRCKHQRCFSCERVPPHKVEPAPDPDVMRSVETKLAALRFASVNTY